MRPTTPWVVSIAGIVFAVSAIGAAPALAFEWPTQFDGSGTPEVTLSEFVTGGTATSIPVGPWAALGLFALLARSQRWWGTAAVGGLGLLAPLFFIGGMGEALAPATPHVPQAVLGVSGTVYALLAVALFLAALAELFARWRGLRRRSPAVGDGSPCWLGKRLAEPGSGDDLMDERR